MPPKPKRLKTTHQLTIFDLPVLDIMVDHVAPYLQSWNLLQLRKCSRKSKILADEMFAGIREMTIISPFLNYPISTGPPPSLLKKCKQLRELRMEHLIWLTDEFLCELLTKNRLLVKVIIVYCPKVTTKGLLPLALHYRTLEHLVLQEMNFGDEFLSAFPENGNKLEMLNISYNKETSTNGLRDFFAKQPHLKTIYMKDMTADLTPCLPTIANVCEDLCYLYIKNNVISDRKGLESIANNCLQIQHMYFDCNLPEVSGQFKDELHRKGIHTWNCSSTSSYDSFELFSTSESD